MTIGDLIKCIPENKYNYIITGKCNYGVSVGSLFILGAYFDDLNKELVFEWE